MMLSVGISISENVQPEDGSSRWPQKLLSIASQKSVISILFAVIIVNCKDSWLTGHKKKHAMKITAF